jgi:hypothetical protein
MLLQKTNWAPAIVLAAGLLAGGGIGWIALGQEAPKRAETSRGPAGREESATAFPVRGRVLDPDDKPVAGAGIYVRHHAEIGWIPVDPMAAKQKGRVAVTDAEGRFHFELDKTAGDVPYGGEIGWQKAQIAAATPGFAPGWVEAGDLAQGGEATLRLVPDAPIRGRVLNSQGRPVSGVVVRIRAIWEVKNGLNLDTLLAAGELDENQMARSYGLHQRVPSWLEDPAPLWPGGQNAWTTDANGRFEVRGVGRDRIARLDLHGGGVADGTIDVMARPTKAPQKARPRPDRLPKESAFMGRFPQGTQLVGSTFDYIGVPAKPITGVVRLKGSGMPVAGAIAWAADAATHTAVTARTDAAGRFRIDGVPKGEFYQLRFNPRPGIDPFLGSWEVVDDTEGLKPLEKAIEVSPGVIVIGRLLDRATGRAVPPTDVTYIKTPDNPVPERAALGFSRPTDASFGLTVPPGPAMIAAAAGGKETPYIRARLKAADRGKGIGDESADREPIRIPLGSFHAYRFINVEAGAGRVNVDLELTRSGLSRTGRLIGPDGKAVKGARCIGLTDTWDACDLEGDTFEVTGLEPDRPRLLCFSHEGRRLVGSAVIKGRPRNGTGPLVVRLGPACSVKGRLLEEDGAPAVDVALECGTLWGDARKSYPGSLAIDGEALHRSGPDALWPDNRTFPVDSQGRFEIVGLRPGVKTHIRIKSTKGQEDSVPLGAGRALNKISPKRFGEVLNVGDGKIKAQVPG